MPAVYLCANSLNRCELIESRVNGGTDWRAAQNPHRLGLDRVL